MVDGVRHVGPLPLHVVLVELSRIAGPHYDLLGRVFGDDVALPTYLGVEADHAHEVSAAA